MTGCEHALTLITTGNQVHIKKILLICLKCKYIFMLHGNVDVNGLGYIGGQHENSTRGW
jgi:hypothetical protein